MSETLARVLLPVAGVYILAGVAFAIPFVVRGSGGVGPGRRRPGARGPGGDVGVPALDPAGIRHPLALPALPLGEGSPMNRPLRRWHLRLVAGLALLALAILVIAVAVRRSPPINAIPA